MKYEYIRLKVELEDLEELNKFGQDGWEVVSTIPNDSDYFHCYLILMRRI